MSWGCLPGMSPGTQMGLVRMRGDNSVVAQGHMEMHRACVCVSVCEIVVRAKVSKWSHLQRVNVGRGNQKVKDKHLP